ncbi:MAG: methyltransferase domain-containing protein [Candidatus Delongbacteria bacterium]|nr:methyltransferase domain-containing protein [Candidatus Delongbacteria bacterium]MBN2836017.1 methyltransferase domain-containing protein [Candidatus Delongbacteria bacterium]
MNNDFYDNLANYYEKIFPVNDEVVNFIIKHVPIGRVLEAGCAKGDLLLKMKNIGYSVFGVDLSQKFIELAKLPDLKNVYCKNLLEINELDILFDSIICFGNTVAHLSSQNELERFFKSSFHSLSEKGILSVQIINYDRILENNIKRLPDIENEDILFEREYNCLEYEKISFNTRLTIKSENKVLENSIILFPFRKANIENLLLKTGFTDFKFFGDFKGSEYDSKSYHLIVNAYKKYL